MSDAGFVRFLDLFGIVLALVFAAIIALAGWVAWKIIEEVD
jgi:hypothetical protein